MIKRLDVTGVSMELDPQLEAYVARKIGSLDRFIPKNKRESVYAEVKLKEDNANNKPERVCEVIVHLPQENLVVKESAVNLQVAVDLAENTLRAQLKKYKDTHSNIGLHRRILHRFKHTPDRA